MKLRLVTDGTVEGTFIVDDATNDPVENVESIDWHYEKGGKGAVGVIRITPMGADMAGEIKRLIGEDER